MKADTDIDIDVSDRNLALQALHCVPASIGGKEKHNTGVYFQDIPKDPLNGFSTIDYKEAMRLGYFKIDFLNVNFYEGIKDEDHLNSLLDMEPDWDMLLDESVVSQLFHLNNHYKECCSMRPRSVEELAMFLAVIRPAKLHLLGKGWSEIKKTIWDKPTDGKYYFKKSHATSYAIAIVVHMNLLKNLLG